MEILEDRLSAYGLASQSGASTTMHRAHRHNDIELNFVERGGLRYLFGGDYVTIDAGRLALFWAAIPHQVVAIDAHTQFVWVTLPLTTFLQWHLPDAFTHSILHGTPIIDPYPQATGWDGPLVRQWHGDLQETAGDRQPIVLLEMEARIRRLALAWCTHTSTIRQDLTLHGPHSQSQHDKASTAEAIARVIGERFTEPLKVHDIAQIVGVHPNYAMTLFRQTFGASIVEYITQYRVAHAQRLLVTTDTPILDIALDVGFGSASRFYAAFKRICGQSAREYRTTVRGSHQRRSRPNETRLQEKHRRELYTTRSSQERAN